MAGERVLVVDDELALRRLLRLHLAKEGYTVLEASTGAEALDQFRNGDVDVALVDVMLPEIDGFELVRTVRRDSTVPIILVTARGEETSRVAGLEVGADDYVVKPFSAPEVVARVRAQLRRAQGFAIDGGTLRGGSVELDPLARRCLVDGQEVELTRREFDLLATLLEHPSQVLSRVQLLEAAWETAYLSEKTVDVHVSSLRKKLGGAVSIVAVRGVGYRLDP
ncbi:MAG TPA: response regulator transcription factor [Gaiellaceae bacterium]|jgi:DNA-binding response OmpR family regulator|nr:response regulator transcription factor [Gaiellaceae bacterium]